MMGLLAKLLQPGSYRFRLDGEVVELEASEFRLLRALAAARVHESLDPKSAVRGALQSLRAVDEAMRDEGEIEVTLG